MLVLLLQQYRRGCSLWSSLFASIILYYVQLQPTDSIMYESCLSSQMDTSTRGLVIINTDGAMLSSWQNTGVGVVIWNNMAKAEGSWQSFLLTLGDHCWSNGPGTGLALLDRSLAAEYFFMSNFKLYLFNEFLLSLCKLINRAECCSGLA